MFKVALTTLIAAIGVAALTLANPALASTVETDSVSTTSQTAFDTSILNNDLINTGQSTLASASETVPGGAGTIAQTHEGSQSFSAWTTVYYANNTDVLTYQLNLNTGTGGSAFGYDITSVTYIGGTTVLIHTAGRTGTSKSLRWPTPHLRPTSLSSTTPLAPMQQRSSSPVPRD